MGCCCSLNAAGGSCLVSPPQVDFSRQSRLLRTFLFHWVFVFSLFSLFSDVTKMDKTKKSKHPRNQNQLYRPPSGQLTLSVFECILLLRNSLVIEEKLQESVAGYKMYKILASPAAHCQSAVRPAQFTIKTKDRIYLIDDGPQSFSRKDCE